MQVRTPTEQHAVMIEAVENHMPEVIVIDEIGTELEAGAARTIAERGVQLVGTAHGNTLDNLMLNPTLSDLVGGIQSVTLGDEEARRRGTQKTVLERKAPPTFDVLVEIVERDNVIVHRNVAETVDAILRGHMVPPEARYRDDAGELKAMTKYDYRISETTVRQPGLRAARADRRLRRLQPRRRARRSRRPVRARRPSRRCPAATPATRRRAARQRTLPGERIAGSARIHRRRRARRRAASWSSALGRDGRRRLGRPADRRPAPGHAIARRPSGR